MLPLWKEIDLTGAVAVSYLLWTLENGSDDYLDTMMAYAALQGHLTALAEEAESIRDRNGRRKGDALVADAASDLCIVCNACSDYCEVMWMPRSLRGPSERRQINGALQTIQEYAIAAGDKLTKAQTIYENAGYVTDWHH
jgi:succinate dehydrogenase/fumarate reductase-like Fe-S protein